MASNGLSHLEPSPTKEGVGGLADRLAARLIIGGLLLVLVGGLGGMIGLTLSGHDVPHALSTITAIVAGYLTAVLPRGGEA